MLIISNCLTEILDEGCLKVANSLTKRIKQAHPDETTVISYGSSCSDSDLHLKLNKLFINPGLISLIRKKRQPVLYIPFSSNTTWSVLRTWILSRFAKNGLSVLFALQHPMNRAAKMLLKSSRAQIIVLSRQAYLYYRSLVGEKAVYVKTGVDTEKFHPVDSERKALLREKYGVVPGKKAVLHAGHLKRGRNIGQLLKLGPEYHVFLVVSSKTQNEQDEQLRMELNQRPNTTIIDTYLPNIEEVYQMSDLYFFPVEEEENCIDVPLSVLEAAACNLPIVTTPYGELKELVNKDGFYQIHSFEADRLNELIQVALKEKKDSRDSVLEYDWMSAVRLMDEWKKR